MTQVRALDDLSRTIFHAAGLPMLLVDPDNGLIEDANEAASRFYGHHRDGLVGHSLEVISRTPRERLRDALSVAAIAGGRFAVRHETATGRVVAVTVTASPVDLDGRRLLVEVITERDADPDAQSMLALLYEATADIHRAAAHARSEAELWSQASRIIVEVGGFRLAWIAMVDEATDGVSVVAAAGDVGYLDGRVDGLRSESLTPVAQSLTENRTVVHEDISEDTAGPYAARAVEHGLRSGASVPMRDADGTPFGALVVLEGPVGSLDGERVALLERLAGDLAVARALIRATARLRASEERYRTMVEQASAGIMVFSQRGWVLDANPAACSMLGYSLPELRAVGGDLVLHDLDAEQESGMRDVLESGASLWVDRRFRRADGEVITVAFHGRRREDGAIEAVVQDVTAERRAQAALQASEARYRNLVGILQEGIITYDAEGRVTEMNEAARVVHAALGADLRGIDARVIGRSFLHEDGSPYPVDELPSQTARRTGRPTERRILGVPQSDGSTRWVSTTAVPVGQDAEGHPTGVVVSFADVTQLREAMARAQASEDRVRALLDEAIDGVLVFDQDGVISYANPAVDRILRTARGGLVGRPVLDFVPPSGRDAFAGDLASIMAGGVVRGEFGVIRADGVELTAEIAGARLPDGRIEVIARDVTERKALEAERRRLAEATEQASDSIMITDAQGRIVYVNRAFEWMHGRLREDVVGQPMETVHPAEGARLEDEISTELAARGAWAGEITHRAKDGRPFRVSSRVVALRDADGTVIGRVATARDISLEREGEARLAQAARLEAIAQLAGGVAHDLNNVLTMIVGHAALLDPLTATPADIAAGVRAITEAAGHAETVTMRLLAFGRRAFLQPRPADLRDLLIAAQPMLARAAGPRTALVVAPGADEVPVSLDPALFEQALLALVVHARDDMPDGGTIRVGVEWPRSDEGLPGVDTAVLVVADSGPGKAPAELDHLFEPFAAAGREAPDLGLGLAMVHGFVEQSGGRVEVASSMGHGTVFRLLLPLTSPTPEPARPPTAAQPPRVGPATILVAEDEAVLRQVALRTLAARGYQVLLASSGEEALTVAAAHEGRIDLLFSDVVMPGLRGPGLAAALLRSRPGMRVLLTSGYAEDIVGRRGIESAPGEFLAKPYTPSILAATVARLLGLDAE